MSANSRVGALVILFTLAVAMVLTLLPLPAALAAARPAFYPATVVFWVLMQPQRFGLVAAWICGVIIDVIYATPFAEHGLALAVAAYAVVKLRDLLEACVLWQQALLLAPVFALYEFLLFWIDGVAGADVDAWWRWLPVATTVLVWPVWAFALERITDLAVE